MRFDSVTAEQLRKALATVVVVPVTPFSQNGGADWDTYARMARRLVDGGIAVITPNGNTGEFYALNPAEARRAAESAITAADRRAEVLAGVGHDCATAI